MHIDNELLLTELPRECIEDCAMPGQDASADVTFWRERLDFTVNRERAIACIVGYGAWERTDLDTRSDDEIAEIILWLACGDFREYIFNAEASGEDPYGENPPESDSGSDVFVLE